MNLDDALAVASLERNNQYTIFSSRLAFGKLADTVLELSDEVKRLREAISYVKQQFDLFETCCPWCENNPEEGHGEWRGKPCPAKEGGE